MATTQQHDLLLQRLKTLANSVCLKILRTLMHTQKAMRVIEVARAIGVHRSTACEALHRLCAVRIVESSQRRYALRHSEELDALMNVIEKHDKSS